MQILIVGSVYQRKMLVTSSMFCTIRLCPRTVSGESKEKGWKSNLNIQASTRCWLNSLRRWGRSWSCLLSWIVVDYIALACTITRTWTTQGGSQGSSITLWDNGHLWMSTISPLQKVFLEMDFAQLKFLKDNI